MINLVIAEDQAMLLSTLSTLLDMEKDICVIHQALNGQNALDFIKTASLRVDMLITDIEMPDLTGLELVEAIKDLPIKTLILTTFSRAGYLRRAMEAGINGYLLKDSPSSELLKAIRKIHTGERIIAPELMQDAWMSKDPLTNKERKALRLASEGLSTEMIAKKMFLSPGTIRNYLSTASSKVNASNRIEAARIARINGWL